MKKRVRIFSIIMLIIITISSFMVTAAYAFDPNEYNPNTNATEVPGKFTNMAGTIANTIQIIGIILSAIVIGLLGIKYMTGSVEERADYKKSMIPFLVGTVMLVAIGTILRLINDLTTQAVGE